MNLWVSTDAKIEMRQVPLVRFAQAHQIGMELVRFWSYIPLLLAKSSLSHPPRPPRSRRARRGGLNALHAREHLRLPGHPPGAARCRLRRGGSGPSAAGAGARGGRSQGAAFGGEPGALGDGEVVVGLASGGKCKRSTGEVRGVGSNHQNLWFAM